MERLDQSVKIYYGPMERMSEERLMKQINIIRVVESRERGRPRTI